MKRTQLNIETASNAQKAAYQMLSDLLGGEHHIAGEVYSATDNGIEAVICGGCWSTFDADRLTRAVLMAHERAIRFEIQPCNFGMLRLFLHRRQREGGFSERHPTIEQAIKRARSKL